MEHCEHFMDMISAQLDGELSPEQERELLDHVLVCEDCRGFQMDLLELNDAMAEMRVQPPEGLVAQISAAVQAEKASNVIPFYKRKNFLGSIITAAAMIALVAVSGTNLTALLDREAQSRDAAQPSVADSADVATLPEESAIPEVFTIIEHIDGEEDSLPEAAVEEQIEDSDALLDTPPVLGNTPIASPQPPPTVDEQMSSGIQPSSDETGTVDLPEVTPEEPAASGSDLASVDETAGQGETNDPASARVALPGDDTGADGDASQIGITQFGLLMAPAPTYIGEITFRAFSPLPDFLAELGVPEADEGFADYQLILSAAEYRALETQFQAHELSYEAVTEGEEFTPSGEFGIIIILYAD